MARGRIVNTFKEGLKDGFPICLGYFFVSFGIGLLAVKSGLTTWIAVLISATNLTSAGQAAGIGIIAAGGTIVELVLTQILINCRYSLMAISLSQKLSSKFTTLHRMIASFGITDEIFGVASSKEHEIEPIYMYGLIIISAIGWVLGTFLGAFCGEILPTILTTSLGILLYGMFIAIIIPPTRKSKAVAVVIVVAACISCIIYYFIPVISSGFSIIISAIVSAGILAWIAPVKEESECD